MKKRKVEKLELLLQKPKYNCFKLIKDEKKVRCFLCNSLIRYYESDLNEHLQTDIHKSKLKNDSYSINKFIQKVTTTEDKSKFNIDIVIHCISKDLPLSTIDTIFTPKFIENLYHNRFNLLNGYTLQTQYLSKAYDYGKEKIQKLMGDHPYSLLIDETSNFGRKIVICCGSNKNGFYTLLVKHLDVGESMNSNIIVNIIEQIINEYKLDPHKFVSYISDNTNYNKTAFNILKKKYLLLNKIGCFSHIINLVIKSIINSKFGFEKMIKLLYNIFVYTNGIFNEKIQYLFKKTFKKSSRSIFYMNNIRWTSIISIFGFISENLEDFVLFLIEFNENQYVNELLSILQNHNIICSIEIVNNLIIPLKKQLLYSQIDDIHKFSTISEEIISYFKTLKMFRNSKEAEKLIINTKLQKSLNLSITEIKDLTNIVIEVCSLSINKYEKHGREIINIVRAINILDTYSGNFPSDLLKYTNTSMFLLINEFNLAKQKKLSKIELLSSDLFTNLCNLIDRIDSIRSGISGVERMFSLLKLILKKQRMNMKNENIEKTLFIRCNANYLNKFI